MDNLIKFVLDALNGLAYVDDSQVAILSSAKLYTDGDGYTQVRIRKLSHSDPWQEGNFVQHTIEASGGDVMH